MNDYEISGIETIARGVCVRDGRLLLCRAKGGSTTYLPGGHIEFGETGRQALVREIKEELTAEISVGELIKTVEYDYPAFHLSMDCFWCEIVSGDLVLKEHEAAKWLKKSELDEVDWLPADLELIESIKQEW